MSLYCHSWVASASDSGTNFMFSTPEKAYEKAVGDTTTYAYAETRTAKTAVALSSSIPSKVATIFQCGTGTSNASVSNYTVTAVLAYSLTTPNTPPAQGYSAERGDIVFYYRWTGYDGNTWVNMNLDTLSDTVSTPTTFNFSIPVPVTNVALSKLQIKMEITSGMTGAGNGKVYLSGCSLKLYDISVSATQANPFPAISSFTVTPGYLKNSNEGVTFNWSAENVTTYDLWVRYPEVADPGSHILTNGSSATVSQVIGGSASALYCKLRATNANGTDTKIIYLPRIVTGDLYIPETYTNPYTEATVTYHKVWSPTLWNSAAGTYLNQADTTVPYASPFTYFKKALALDTIPVDGIAYPTAMTLTQGYDTQLTGVLANVTDTASSTTVLLRESPPSPVWHNSFRSSTAYLVFSGFGTGTKMITPFVDFIDDSDSVEYSGGTSYMDCNGQEYKIVEGRGVQGSVAVEYSIDNGSTWRGLSSTGVSADLAQVKIRAEATSDSWSLFDTCGNEVVDPLRADGCIIISRVYLHTS